MPEFDEKSKEIISRMRTILDPILLLPHPFIENLDMSARAVYDGRKHSANFTSMQNKEDFQKRFWYCIWKMNAVWYHVNNIIMLEENYKKTISKYVKIFYQPGSFGAISTEKMELEFEAFLFQAKACLDVFSRSFKPYLKNESSNTKGLKKELKKNLSDPTCQKIFTELTSSEWLKEFEKNKPSYRDLITHYKKISISPVNIYPENKKVVIAPSLITDRQTNEKISVKFYVEEKMDQIFTLIRNSYSYLLFDGIDIRTQATEL